MDFGIGPQAVIRARKLELPAYAVAHIEAQAALCSLTVVQYVEALLISSVVSHLGAVPSGPCEQVRVLSDQSGGGLQLSLVGRGW